MQVRQPTIAEDPTFTKLLKSDVPIGVVPDSSREGVEEPDVVGELKYDWAQLPVGTELAEVRRGVKETELREEV